MKCPTCPRDVPDFGINRDGVCFACVTKKYGFDAVCGVHLPEPLPLEATSAEAERAELEAAAAREEGHAARLAARTEAVKRYKALVLETAETALRVAPHVLNLIDGDTESSARRLHGALFQALGER